MTASELRIGNITDKGAIVNLLESGIHVGRGKCFNYDEVNPVELSPDWLERLGFENISRTNIFVKVVHRIGATKLKSLAVYLDENSYTVAIVDYYTGVEKTDLLHLNYKYLHQLQNLYHSLTGQELITGEKEGV